MYPYFQNNQNNLIRVNGIDGARAYQMNANSVTALFDANEDIFYVKVTDGAGFPTIRTFKFEEVNPIQQNNEFMTKKEVEAYVKQLISEQPTKRNSKSSKANDELSDD